jgi:hypothetical protein
MIIFIEDDTQRHLLQSPYYEFGGAININIADWNQIMSSYPSLHPMQLQNIPGMELKCMEFPYLTQNLLLHR